ncbi:Gp37-like protein, partial [Nocardia rhamnosiphila]|uniref:Gp37-like protein n=2 Tax=Nocardia TaxID=1817 RepID=UPI0007A37802
MAVTSMDADQVFWDIVNREFDQREKRLRPPVIKLYDGNWTLRGRVNHYYNASFTEVEWETGIGRFEMPEEHYLSKWVVDHETREFKNIHVSCEKDGVRWTGRLDHWEVEKTNDGKVVIRCVFKHDYEELKHIIFWSNPFLPAELQFPKIWLLFGTAKWVIKTSLLVNIMRLESSLWMLPDNPLDASQWNDFNQANWSMVVKPDLGEPDNSPLALLYARFQYAHDSCVDIGEDAQLTPTFRRYFEGDEPPWPGANLRHGCLVIDIENNSGHLTGTSFGGSLFTGLIHALISVGSNGLQEGVDIMDDPAWPEEYYESGWKGTLPVAPGLIYREGEHTGIQTSLFHANPAKDVQHVVGGHSMPGVNELISASIQLAGDLIAAIVGIPPLGGVADAILKPLYEDVFLAFMAWKDVGRAQSLGFSHYHERIAEG